MLPRWQWDLVKLGVRLFKAHSHSIGPYPLAADEITGSPMAGTRLEDLVIDSVEQDRMFPSGPGSSGSCL